ncbi:MAG: SusE domain-containing protein [Bacteroidales bacterium]|nr:SusE domain-containing protein [Bacteroidales bacterium]
MKTLRLILASLVAVLAFASCEKNLEELRFSDNPTAPVLNQAGDINITAENEKSGTYTLTWKAADFGLPTEIVYTVVGKNGGKTATLFENIRGTSHVVKNDELKTKLVSSLGVKAGESTTLSFSLTATTGSGYTVLTSNEVSVKALVE